WKPHQARTGRIRLPPRVNSISACPIAVASGEMASNSPALSARNLSSSAETRAAMDCGESRAPTTAEASGQRTPGQRTPEPSMSGRRPASRSCGRSWNDVSADGHDLVLLVTGIIGDRDDEDAVIVLVPEVE